LCDAKSGRKLGLGSSSAVAVALTAALSRITSSPIDVLSIAAEAHREFQRGHGSGTDIASSFHGGVIQYRMHPGQAPMQPGWPAGLAYRLFWSGNSAATTDQLLKYLPVMAEKSASPSHRALSEMAGKVAASWSHGNAAATFTALSDYATALRIFSDDCKLGIFAAGHGQMADLASACGIVYKPCGAGGGDVGIALSLDKRRLDKFTAGAARTSFRQLDVRLDCQGVRIDSENRD
jgi:phosphomevalonate kinase